VRLELGCRREREQEVQVKVCQWARLELGCRREREHEGDPLKIEGGNEQGANRVWGCRKERSVGEIRVGLQEGAGAGSAGEGMSVGEIGVGLQEGARA
jgi:hypothetical protein